MIIKFCFTLYYSKLVSAKSNYVSITLVLRIYEAKKYLIYNFIR